MAKLTALRGTRDLVTPEIVRWHEMEEAARRVLGRACFTEIRTPVFERTALFERGVGEATDIVQKEMYSFETRSGDAVTLRPENTAGVVRAYLELGLAGKLPAPLKVWYAGPMFRYERPQKGRQRQFHQVGVEVIDTADPRADAEVIIVACEFLRDLGLDDLVVDLNSLGDAEDRVRHREDLVKFLRGVEDKLDPDSVNRLERNPLRVLDSKNEKTREAVADAPMLPEYLGAEARAHFEDVKALLDAAGVKYRLVPSLVRGLDYYSRTTFEIQSENLGAQSTVCGGGRYDGLVEQLGGSRVPAVGWALGLERLAIILDEVRGKPEPVGPVAYIVSLGDAARNAVLPLATELRRAGVRCDVSFSGGGFGKQFKAADRRGARYAVVLGDAEVEKGTVSVKHLGSGEQQEMERSALADFLLREDAGS
ncbi:MAG: histidine--tRNA ligase [Gemmatimonadetes bacterium]|nr:histidine--tRNA ligase [Gemmatimonadota bacterium]